MKKLSKEHKLKISLSLRGKKKTAEHVKKYSDSHRGKKHTDVMGIKNHNWKGDETGYYNKHTWCYRNWGQPLFCEFCGRTDLRKSQYQWASKNHEYKRTRNDWLRLCVSCHRNYDLEIKKNKNIC